MAELQVGIKANVAEARKVTRALKEIKKAAGGTTGSLQATSVAASKTSVSLQTTVSASGQLAVAQNIAATANVAVSKTLNSVAGAATATATAEANATKATNSLAAAFTRLRVAAGGALAKTAANAGTLATQMKTAAGSVVGASTAVVGIGAAIAVGIGVGVKSAKDFEEKMAQIQGLVGLTTDEVEALKGPLEDIGRATAKGPTELAEALFFITSAGARGQEALDILESSAKAAAAGLGETKQVADAVTSAMNAYGAANLSASRATDILVATVKEGKAEADSIAGSLGQILPTASELGIEFEELGGVLAALTRIGLGADAGATALGATMAAIQKPGADARKALREFGLSASGLRKTIREQGLLVGLQQMKEAFGDNETALTRVVPNIRALRAVLPLIGKNAGDVADIFEAVKNSVGNADNAFNVVENTVGFKLDSALTDMAFNLKDIGDVFLPLVVAVAQVASKVLSGLTTVIVAVGDGFAFAGKAAKMFGETLAEALSGSDDPVIRNLNNIRELDDELKRLEAGGSLRKFFTEVGGIELTGSRDDQLQQLREALTLQRSIELQNGREELQRQRIAALAEDQKDTLEEIGKVNVNDGVVVNEELRAKGIEAYKKLRAEVEFLTGDLTNLQELGQEGLGLQEDITETRAIFRALQGDTTASAAEIRKLINAKRALTDQIDEISEAFARQEAATDFLDDLATDTGLLQAKFAALQAGSSMLNIDTLQQAQQIFADLGDQANGQTVESIQQQILFQNALNTAIAQMPVDKFAELKTQVELLEQLNADPESSYFGKLGPQIQAVGDAAIDAVLKAQGLSGLDQILLDAMPKEQQFAEAGLRLKAAFNLKGIVDPESNPEFVAALAALKDKIFEVGDSTNEFAIQAARNLQSAFADFLFDPFSEGLDGMLRGFAETLKRMAAEALSQQLLSSLFSSMAGAGGGTGLIAGLGQALGGQLADGGPVKANTPYLVGERGPEIFQAGQSGNIVSNEMMRGQANPAPQVNVAPAPVIVVDDPSKVEKALQSANGQRALVEAITEKRGAVKQALQ